MRGGPGSRTRAFAVALILLASAAPALAEYYVYTDSGGRTHMVDGLDKVPREHRSKARPWSSPQATPEQRDAPNPPRPQPDRPSWLEDDPDEAAEPAAGAAPRAPAVAREAAEPAERTGAASALPDAGELARRASDALGAGAAGSFPLGGRDALLLWIVGLVLGLASRGAASFRAASIARRIGDFADRYERLVASGPAPGWTWKEARALEEDLAPVVDAVRAAEIGPTTVAAVRTMGGQAVDAGRVDALRGCLADAELAAPTRLLLRGAEGVCRHRARAPWLPTGWLETVLFLPRFLVWRGPGRGDASGIRLLLVLYWLWLAVYAMRGG